MILRLKTKSISLIKKRIVLAFLISSSLALPVYGFVMESNSYQIQSDSINIGGLRSESASYIQESTIGEVATGLSDSSNYSLKAGYQQMQAVYLAFSAINDVVMSPSLGSITGGTSNGGVQFIVTTDSSTGFSITINTASSNGIEGEDTTGIIPHLIPATPGVPDYTFTTAPANSAAFAYTINASTTGEITAPFKNNGSDTCGAGATETDENCWLNATTTAYTIVNRSTRTPTSGATSTLKYRAVISADPEPLILEDIYTATTTLTAVAN